MKFRKKPVVIEAIQWDGANYSEIEAFVGIEGAFNGETEPPTWQIITKEGTMTANRGDWIIKGVKGEFYPCKPDIFAATYELVVEAQ
jgi:hypothetical protein